MMLGMVAGGPEWDEVETIIIEKLGGLEGLEVRSKVCSQDTPRHLILSRSLF